MAGRNLFADESAQEGAGRNLFEPEGFGTTGMDLSPQPSEQSFAGGAVQQTLQGATVGFSDEAQALIGALYAKTIDFFDQNPALSDKTFAQAMADIRNSIREQNQQFQEENPKTSLGLQIAGGLATGGALGGSKVAGAKTLQQAATASAKTGGTIGAIAGAGFADAEDFFSQETLEEAAKTGILGAALGALTPAMIQQALKAGKSIPKALPESLMETAVKVRPSVPQDKRASMIRTALDEGIMPTTHGLELISAKLSNLDRGLNKIIDGATERGVMVSKKALFTELKKLRQDLGGVNLRAAKNVKQIDNIAATFDKQLKAINKSKLTPREVQDLKRTAYRQLRFDVSQQSASFATTEAEKGIIRGAKKSLEKIGPEVEKINQREGRLLELGDELERAVGRLDNRNLISLDTAAKVAAGAATGSPVGTGVGVGASALGAPRVKARTALILENMRKMGEIAEDLNKSLPPEAAAAFAILVEDNKEALSELIE